MEDAPLLIIGAGPAGLALACHHHGPTQIIEAGHEVGGLCRSIEFGGALFDIGGHSFHTPFPEVAAWIAELMTGNWEEQRRDARVWFDGAMIPYPFQQHLGQIGDALIVDECRNALPQDVSAAAASAHFEEWIERRFGTGIARHFMRPYNRKLWARDLSSMDTDWVAERVVGGEGKAGAAPKRVPLSSDAMVGYPASGGFVEISRAMARRAGPIAFGERVVAIDPVARTARCASGAVFGWDRLVSTMPLPMLLDCLPDCPQELREAALRLETLSMKLVLIAADKAQGARPQRLYVADADCPAHKIAFNHMSSSSLRERPREAVMGEVSWSASKPVADDAALGKALIHWLAERDMIEAEGAEARVIDVPHAYPVPVLHRAESVGAIRAWIEPKGIFSIGRFGGWNYANSDACIREGMMLAQSLRG